MVDDLNLDIRLHFFYGSSVGRILTILFTWCAKNYEF